MPKKTWLVKGSKRRSFPDAIDDDLRLHCKILLYMFSDGDPPLSGSTPAIATRIFMQEVSRLLASIGPLCAQ